MPKKKTTLASNNDVGEALALLAETLTEEEARIRDEGAEAMKTGAYDTATDVIDFAKQLLAFQEKVSTLADEWEEIENARDAATPEVQEIVSMKFFGKKRKGIITTQDEYCQPLLEVLFEMGGKGPTDKVLDRLGEKMKDILKPIDYECHKSNDKQKGGFVIDTPHGNYSPDWTIVYRKQDGHLKLFFVVETKFDKRLKKGSVQNDANLRGIYELNFVNKKLTQEALADIVFG